MLRCILCHCKQALHVQKINLMNACVSTREANVAFRANTPTVKRHFGFKPGHEQQSIPYPHTPWNLLYLPYISFCRVRLFSENIVSIHYILV